MDGQYLNNIEIKKNIQKWLDTTCPPKGTWESNNLHVDEIKGLSKLKRDEWATISFAIFNIAQQIKLTNSLILFLHFDMSFSINKLVLNNLSMNWLQQNISEYTPPSFNCTTKEYYDNFYKNELIKCCPDEDLLRLINSTIEIEFFYRTYFDENEDMYSREIYVFEKQG
jgi:hypothetical protein